MKYQHIRSSIETGDLYFEYPKDIIGWIISKVTQSDLIHVGMFVVLGGRVFTVECRYGMKCRMMLASNRLRKDFVFTKTRAHPEVDKVIADVGVTGYNVLGVIISWFTRFTEKGRTFCSEFVARKLNLTFPHLNRGIYPIDIYDHYTK